MGGSGGSSSGAGGSGSNPDAGTVTPGLKSGPFKILVITAALDFAHDSIPTGLQMLKDLGQSSEADLAKAGAAAGNSWTVDDIGPPRTRTSNLSPVT